MPKAADCTSLPTTITVREATVGPLGTSSVSGGSNAVERLRSWADQASAQQSDKGRSWFLDQILYWTPALELTPFCAFLGGRPLIEPDTARRTP